MGNSRFLNRVTIPTVFVCLVLYLLIAACGPSEIAFAVKHLRDVTREQITEVVSYETYPGLDLSLIHI